jgi:hypothetical protein
MDLRAAVGRCPHRGVHGRILPVTTVLSLIIGVTTAIASTPTVVCVHLSWGVRMLFGLAGLVPATIWAATHESFPTTLGPYIFVVLVIKAGYEWRRRMNASVPKIGSR